MSFETTLIRIDDLKKTIVSLRMANNEGRSDMVETYCLIAGDQLKSLEHNVRRCDRTGELKLNER